MFNILIILLFNYIYVFSFDSTCVSCKWFVNMNVPKSNDLALNLGFCRYFKEKIGKDKTERVVYNFAKVCRENENMCGKYAIHYEAKPITK